MTQRTTISEVGATDVVVVGGGNAGLCAALAAAEQGSQVVLLERGRVEERGGNSRFTAGAVRIAYSDGPDLRKVIPELSDKEFEECDFGSYTEEQFLEDMARVTQYRTDPALAECLVRQSAPTMRWLLGKGIRFGPMYGRQAFRVDGRFRFWGGVTVEVIGGGPGLVEGLYHAAERAGVHIFYQARARELYREAGAVRGVRFEAEGNEQLLRASGVVLACGGFESNAAWRAQYLGPGWDLAKVRGTRYNVGDGLEMAFATGADPAGHWSGCHAVAWDRNAPDYGDLTVGDAFQKHSYPLGIIVNIRGERFVDEGADFRNYTYAKYGQEILRQPEQVAWQVFDQKVTGMLRDEYRIRQVSKVRADTLEDLAHQMDGIDEGRFLATVADFNRAVRSDVTFDPNARDGRATEGIQPRKSNWANTLDAPPYEAYQVTCGVTFTFGGLRITPDASVVGSDGAPIAGLFAAGEIVGGLFYFNYPGGTGLTSGAVFGQIAGTNAAHSNTT